MPVARWEERYAVIGMSMPDQRVIGNPNTGAADHFNLKRASVLKLPMEIGT